MTLFGKKTCSIEECDDKQYCKELCKKCYMKLYYKNNLDKRQKYLEDNIDKISEYTQLYRNGKGKKWHEENKWRRETYDKTYNEKYPERVRESKKKWNESNPDYQKNHPEIGLKSNKKCLEKLGKIFGMTTNKYMYASISWSVTVRKLDNHMCKLCNSIKNLHAHHIQPKSQFPELALDLDNGITLCKPCHWKIHGYGEY